MGNAESGGGGGGDFGGDRDCRGPGFSVASDGHGFSIDAGRDGVVVSGGPAGISTSHGRDGSARISNDVRQVSSMNTVKMIAAEARQQREGSTNKALQGVAAAYGEYEGHGTLGFSTHSSLSDFSKTTTHAPYGVSSIDIRTSGGGR